MQGGEGEAAAALGPSVFKNAEPLVRVQGRRRDSAIARRGNWVYTHRQHRGRSKPERTTHPPPYSLPRVTVATRLLVRRRDPQRGSSAGLLGGSWK